MDRLELLRLGLHVVLQRTHMSTAKKTVVISYNDATGSHKTAPLHFDDERVAEVVFEAVTAYNTATPSRPPSDGVEGAEPQVRVRQRAQVMWNQPGEFATLELGEDNLIHISTGFIGLMHLTWHEAARFANAIGRLVSMANGHRRGEPFKPQRDCTLCQEDEIHEVHITKAEHVERGRKLNQLIRSQRREP